MVLCVSPLRAETFPPEHVDFFEKKVRPLLSEHCYECHSVKAERLEAGLRVDSRHALIEGGDSGESILPGDPDGSLLMEAVRWESYEMPPKGKLSDDQTETLEHWIRLGAPWPEEEDPQQETARPEFDLEQRKQEHWAWQPIRSPEIPQVQQSDWPRSSIDRFILAKLEDHNLEPAGEASRLTVLRRLYFDLIGMPPTPEQIERFLADSSADAIDKVVDSLLDSPHFGERWGRHWLDLVRYAESRGHEFDDDAHGAYQYRDYIIRALNADLPYDQLVREHLAGDLLEDPRRHPQEGFNESILGTGFWHLGDWVHSPVDVLKDESDRFDNMIDVMSKAFLGMTVSCARCHDHKFDAISTADYYSLTGFLQSSTYRQVRFESIEQNRQVAKRLARVDSAFREQIGTVLSNHEIERPTTKPLPTAITELLVVDYSALPSRGFHQDGYLFGEGPRLAGQPWLDASGETPRVRFATRGQAISDPFWNGLKSIERKGLQDRSKLSPLPRSGRTLHTPTFEVTGGTVACSVSGSGHVVACVDSHRHIAGPLHGETVKAISGSDSFVVLALDRYLGHRLHLEFTPKEDAELAVAYVIQGSSQQVQDAIAEVSAEESDEAWSDEAWRDFAAKIEGQAGDELDGLAKDWAASRSGLSSQVVRRSHTAMAMMDGTGEEASIYIRGNSSKPGEVVPRHFLTAISGGTPLAIEEGSGRLALAEQITDPSNPLTARVAVNRIWHHLMGRGLVPTTDDFGVLGQRPTHPELLDHLATGFLAEGQSIKSVIRQIVLSRSYQMSSHRDERAVEADPKNACWHHRPPRRLEGETIRDSVLYIAGNLDPTPFGPSVPTHLTPFMKGRGRPATSGPVDGDGRRSIYVSVRRNFLSPFMLTFDTPAPSSTMGRRNVSNVPAQALIMMNDPFVLQQARGLAGRALARGESPAELVHWMYLTALSREPSAVELASAIDFLGLSPTIEPWTDYAHALLNTKEFIFIR